MRALIAGWVGSTNLGDELVLAGLRHFLAGSGVRAHVFSRDPRATHRDHGLPATGHTDLPYIARRLHEADLVILGGGGLVQDETSALNLPYHLSRIWGAEAARTPWVGLGLGVGPLGTPLGRQLARTLGRAAAVSVRDEPSRRLLEGIGVRDAVLGADLAFHLPQPEVEVEDVATVSLRPWTGGGGGLVPVGLRRTVDETPPWFVAGAARALDELHTATGLGIRFVALQTDRDRDLHQRVAERMTSTPELRVPTLATVVGEVARGRAVVAMRYHAAISAVLGGRPVVALGYSPKVTALAGDLGAGARLLRWHPDDLARLPSEVDAVLGRDEHVAAGRALLTARAGANRVVLERGLAAAAAHR